jgi:hypothetical protein
MVSEPETTVGPHRRGSAACGGGDELQARAAGLDRGVVVVRSRRPAACTSTWRQRHLVLAAVLGRGGRRGVEMQEANLVVLRRDAHVQPGGDQRHSEKQVQACDASRRCGVVSVD